MKFTKMQGAGNDFVLVEADNLTRDWAKMAIAVCHRHLGIGADGLLLLMPSEKADFGMRIFNPDGSEAEACGNGLRCLAKYIWSKGLTRSREITVETASGKRQVKFRKAGGTTSIQVSMGKPELRPKHIPVAVGESLVDITPLLDHPFTVDGWQLKLDFVSMGNPHAVYFWQQPVAEFPLSELGPKIEHHQIFPNRVNFEVARVTSRREIEVRVWERGAGETQACGSGACAVAIAAQLHGYTDNRVEIELPGGTLNVEWDGVGEVFLGGPAEIVFTGDWPEEQI